MNYAGGLSGAALGFIAGDLPGAFWGANLGYQAGKTYQNSMKRKADSSRTANPKRRNSKIPTSSYSKYLRKSIKAGAKLRKSAGHSKDNTTSNFKSESSSNQRKAAVINRNSSKVSFKKKPSVRISRRFKLQVTKALEPSKSFGRYTEIGVSNSQLPLSLGGKQFAGRLCLDAGAGVGSLLFSPLEVLDQASVLFNSKTDSQTSKAQASGLNTTISGNTLDFRSVKINVVNQYYKLVMRNNSPRTVSIQLYECSPKHRQNVIDTGDTLTQLEGTLINESSNATGSNAGKQINMNAVSINTLYVGPHTCPTIYKHWSFEKHDITMDPGQTYTHIIQGPTGVYDFSKFWKTDNSGASDVFLNIIPQFSRHVFMTYRNDICAGDGNVFGRWGQANTTYAVGWEYTKHSRIECPEMAGGVVDTVEGSLGATTSHPFILNQKRNCYFHKNYTESTTIAPTVRIEAQSATDVV